MVVLYWIMVTIVTLTVIVYRICFLAGAEWAKKWKIIGYIAGILMVLLFLLPSLFNL